MRSRFRARYGRRACPRHGSKQAVRTVKEDCARFQLARPSTPQGQEIGRIRALARDLPKLWVAPSTQPIDRQQIIRILVERVEATAAKAIAWT